MTTIRSGEEALPGAAVLEAATTGPRCVLPSTWQVLQTDDGCRVVGTVNDRERRAWETVYELGRAQPADVAPAIGTQQDDAARVLDALHRRRLLMRLDDSYVAVGGLADRRA